MYSNRYFCLVDSTNYMIYFEFGKNTLTLKDMGFLVSQIHGGGLIQSILEKRSVTPPNFILEQQTESHMKAEVFS